MTDLKSLCIDILMIIAIGLFRYGFNGCNH